MPTPDRWEPTQSQVAHVENLFARLDTPRAGRHFVRNALAHAPGRVVGNQRGNSIVKFNSRKNARMMALESRSGEYPQAILLENDPDVVFWICQAPKESIKVLTAEGTKATVVPYCLDFLVIRQNRIEAIEVRDEGTLYKKSLASPHRFWFEDAADKWHFRPAEEHFAALGIDFHVIANRQINSVYVNNLKYLEDFLTASAPAADDVVIRRLQDRVNDVKRLSFLEAIASGFTPDQVLAAIAHLQVYVDLNNDRIDSPEQCAMYASEAVRQVYRLHEIQNREPIQPVPGSMFLRAGAQIVYGGRRYEVLLCGERDVLVRDENDQTQKLDLAMLKHRHQAGDLQVDGLMPKEGPRELSECSESELTLAFRRLTALRTRDTSEFSSRSLSRFARATRGLDDQLAQVLSLVDNASNRGNRNPRYSDEDEAAVLKAISEKYNRNVACMKAAAYRHYVSNTAEANAAEDSAKQLQVMSYPTFCRRVEKFKDVRLRKGKRAAYQEAPIVSTVHDPFPVHGVMPHEVCYVDHTLMNLATISGDGLNVPLNKPWLTVAIDGFTTQARALIMTYDPPSATTVLLVMRDYVRRHKRLPKMLSLDNGKEFRGQQLQRFCMLYGIDLRFRAPGQPRGGAPIESTLGAIEREVVTQLTGNTVQMKDPRLVTKSVNGFNYPVHTLTSAYNIIDEYLFKVREHRIHPVLGKSPADVERERLATAGTREHIYIRYDENLLLATSPFAPRIEHKVCPRRGVWFNHRFYRHPALEGLKRDTRVRVRIEPFAARLIYVEVNGRWHAAIGRNSRDLDGRTLREYQIALRAQQKVAGTAARTSRMSYRKDDPLRHLQPKDFDVRLGHQQHEIKYLLNQNQLLGAMAPSSEVLKVDELFDFTDAPSMPPERTRPDMSFDQDNRLPPIDVDDTPPLNVAGPSWDSQSIEIESSDCDSEQSGCDGFF